MPSGTEPVERGGRGEESVFFSFFPSRSKIRGRREVGEEGNARSELNYRDKTNMFINGKDWKDWIGFATRLLRSLEK